MHDPNLNTQSNNIGPRWLWLTLLVITVLWMATLGTRRLLEPDEGRYAEIPREMLVSGDFVTPRLNGLKYFEKPPLQYWMTASAYQVLGQNEFAARLWTGITGLLGIGFAALVGTRLFGRAAGLMAAATLASSLLYVVIGHINTLDMSLSFFLQVTVCSFLLAQQAAEKSAAERNWMLLAWAGAALAFLSKGLVALILPALTLALYSVITRELSAWRRLHIIKGLALFLLLALPWLVAIARANPEFLRFFFIHEQFERFAADTHDRDGPWWYFLPLFVLGTLPWSFVALRQFVYSWRVDSAVSGLQTRRFLLLWVVGVIGFFSLSHSKLPPYIVPVLPMFAILIGDALTRVSSTALRMHLWIMGGLIAALGVVVSLLPDTIAGRKAVDLVIDLRPETSSGFIIAGASLLLAGWQTRRNPAFTAVLTAGIGTLLGLSVLIQGSDALRATRSGITLAEQIAPVLTPETRLFSVRDYEQTLPFYLKRTMTLVNYRGELDFGLTQQPELGIDNIEAFAHEWREQTDAIAVMSPKLYAELLNQDLPMQVVGKQADLIAIKNP